MKFNKLISVLLHPMVIPTLGILLYFVCIPNTIQEPQKLFLLGLIFIASYLVPLFVLMFLKALHIIHSFQVHSIKERKIPIILMILVFYFLANFLGEFIALKDISLLLYATSFGLIAIYFLFVFKTKTSLHMLSMGIFLGFFLVLSNKYQLYLILPITVLLLLSGLLASARLKLKAHTPKEVYLGYFLGICSQMITYYFL